MDLLFPPVCPICSVVRPLSLKGTSCSFCSKLLIPIHEPKCFKCGRQLGSTDVEYCTNCINNDYPFIKGFSPYTYSGIPRDLILKLKYNGRGDLALFFAKEIYNYCEEELSLLKIDAIIPVPIHKKRLLERGYNQAELVANELSKLLNIPCYNNFLLRIKETTAQKQLGKYSRIINLYDAFSVDHNAFDYAQRNTKNSLRTALIVDDIYTSGSTISTCAQYLRELGFSKIYFVTVCSTSVDN